MNIESISPVLQQLRLYSYLNTQSIIAASTASSTLFALFSSFINFRIVLPHSRGNKFPIKYKPKRLSVEIPNKRTLRYQSLEDWVLNFPPPSLILLRTITHLNISIQEGGQSNFSFFHKLPQSLKELCITNHKQNEDPLYFEALPKGLKSLIIVRCCIDDSTLDCLPPNLTHFTIVSDTFIRQFNYLPSSLINLSLFGPQNSNYDCYVPPKVTHLCLSGAESFDHLPLSITHLELWCSSTFQYLPSSITRLIISGFPTDLDYLPQSLKYLSVHDLHSSSNVDHLPPSLTRLVVGHYDLAVDNLPPNLTHLTLRRSRHYIDHLPSTLKFLALGEFNKHIDNLPPSLKHLILGDNFSKPIDHLPPTLTSLVVGKYFASPLDHLPKSLQRLDLSKSYYYKTKPAIGIGRLTNLIR